MLTQFKNCRFYIILTLDAVLFITAFVGAYLLRFDFILAPVYRSQILNLLPFLVPGKILIFSLLGMYQGMWRYTSLHNLWQLSKACLLSMLYYITAVLYLHGHQGIPRSVFLLDAMLTFFLCGGLRLGIRLVYAAAHADRLRLPVFSIKDDLRSPAKSVVIIGAGNAGEKMLREIFENPHLNYQVEGFLDDDHAKWGRRLHGQKVLGGIEKLPEIVKQRNIDEVLIATPCATGPQMRGIIEICKNSEVYYRTLPEIGAIINGNVSIKSLRDVKYEDLLRRQPVTLDKSELSQYLQGKRVLVTGAGGSIGSELCRQIIRFSPGKLILVDAGEANLYKIQMELQHEINFSDYQCILGRIENKSVMEDVFKEYRPQIIFHAAAYKHVPLLEQNPWEAVFNNVLGSQVIMNLARQYQVDRVVLVSTDKAVRPTNVMGASKRLAELIVQSLQGNGTRFMAVRFGNVIGSSGSVLPLFRRQLEHGGPITVTHPEVTRYFMTIPEAAQLILQAGGLGEGGEIFILEMGTPVKIAKMAEDLIRLSGKEPGRDVEIIYTGLRAGEKLYEELITQGENIMPTRHKKILMIRSNGWNCKETHEEFAQWLDSVLKELYSTAQTFDAQAIKGKFSEILPEYLPQANSS
jgi:FlaA1/EpsC-like NDP-sugar epimerase